MYVDTKTDTRESIGGFCGLGEKLVDKQCTVLEYDTSPQGDTHRHVQSIKKCIASIQLPPLMAATATEEEEYVTW